MDERNQDKVIIDVVLFYKEFNSTGDQYRKKDKCRCSVNKNIKNLVQLRKDVRFVIFFNKFLFLSTLVARFTS